MSDDARAENEEVLQRMAAAGVDLDRPLSIEFMIAAPAAAAAEAVAAVVRAAGFAVQVVHDEGEPGEDGEVEPDDEEFGPSWTVYAAVTMVPSADAITEVEERLAQLAEPHGAYPDGWGTMG